MVRRIFTIVFQIGILCIFFLIGTWIETALNLVIPGSVIGLVLLFLCLYFRIIPERFVREGAQWMTKHLILFFIPATVGIMNYFDLLLGKGFALVIITVVSSLIVLLISSYVTEKLTIRKESKHG
ncbi:MAG TPA: CidA/LrgA family protein [Pseudogracilibacillus sp.]|nr:CidA/LrgA family protein [Pseudogracilibacillus sp.]